VTGALGRRFEIGLALRLAALLLAAAALASAAARPGLYATTLLAGLAAAAAAVELWRFLQRTNRVVARFVEALHHGDLTQGFAAGSGAGFATLGASLDAAVARLRRERAAAEDENRYLAALLDDVPSPLISLADDGRIALLNKAARRLAVGGTLADRATLGGSLAADVAGLAPGQRRQTRLDIAGVPTAALIGMAELRNAGGGRSRILSVQPIQQELDRAELAAQTDLVRVLTHEIMNSMTPVTSLSATAAALIAAADTGRDPAIADARAAIETVARRAEGVMHFVRTYRQLTRPPELRRRRVELAALFAELGRLFASDWPDLPLAVEVAPPGLAVDADPDLLAQLLINLLRNAAQAAVAGGAAPRVGLAAAARKGGSVAIDVTDNGAGIPEELRQDIFLPFFSTKAEGTGVGLSLARQVALAHGGALVAEPLAEGGTRFRLTL